jgi:hypothetical protein
MIGVRWQSPDQSPEADKVDEMRLELGHDLLDRVSGTMRTYQQDRRVTDRPSIADQLRAHMAQERQPVLMSAANPDGWKLEELLEQLREEVMEKNERLQGGEFGIDAASTRRMMVRATVREQNERIIALLMQAALIQREILADLATLGPDQGPRGTARV